MEEKKGIKIRLSSLILIIVILALITGLIYIFLENQNLNKKINNQDNTVISPNDNLSKTMTQDDSIINQLNAQLIEKDNAIAQLQKEITELKKTNSKNQTPTSTNNYTIGTIKNIYDVISDNDTKLVQAQKIAKEVMNAVNSKDWYYLAKMVGTDADYFVEYGIYNYNVDINNCRELDGEYIFNESYSFDKTKLESPKDIALGCMLIIEFEDDGGRIRINPNCTGV